MKKDVMSSYDKIAELYDEETSNSQMSIEYNYIINKFIKSVDNGLILDVGCGSSPFTTDTVDTIGLDFSIEQLNQCSDNSVPLIQADMTELPIQSNYFNGLIALYSFIHIPENLKLDTLKEFNRILKENSYILLVVGSNEWKGSNNNWLNSNSNMKWDMVGPDKTEKQLKKVGFEIIEKVNVRSSLGEGDCKTFFLIKN